MTDVASSPRTASARLARVAVHWLVALFVCAAAAGAHAQPGDSLPTRVGRVASVQGTLYHSPDDGAGAWSRIGLNYPVAQGDNLWAGHDARAEVDYGGGQFRLAPDSNVHVSRLDERQLAMFIASGGVAVRVRVLAADDSVRIDTPTTQVGLNRPGLYRIDVDPGAAQTTLIVREGEADVATASGAQQVLPGQTARLRDAPNVTADIRNGSSVDGFDTWSAERDRVYEAPRANAYVSREMVGQYDLDAYGTWQTYPDYGAVWFPTVDAEWAPYRFGQWTWLSGWGYAWVDNAPWGYAPFHYGRWAHIGGRWAWCPGAFVARPAWAPALVAWYGGAGWSYSIAGGAPVYGWVPLGWGEAFVPWWQGCTSRCYSRYNRPYAVNVADRRGTRPAQFANWSAPGGVTAVPAATLATGRPVAINRVPIAATRPVAPPLLAAPPAVPPAPLRPDALRPGNGVPLPAATHAAQAPLRIDDGRNVLPAVGPRTPGPNADTAIARPIAPSVRPAVPLRAPIAQPRVAPSPAPEAERSLRPAPAPLSPTTPERALRPVPVPPPAVRPAPIRVPAPQTPLPSMPAPQAPSPTLPRLAPAPPAPLAPMPPVPLAPAPLRVVPAPAAVPAPAVPERGPARVAPAPPKSPGSGS